MKRFLPPGAEYRLPFILLGAALVAVPFLAIQGENPSVESPFPIWFLITLFIGGWPATAVVAVALPFTFWVSQPDLWAGIAPLHVAPRALYAFTSLCSLAWSIAGQGAAQRHQGHAYATTILVVNAVAATVFTAAATRGHKNQSWVLAFLLHWLFFAWAGSYAFAYMGETP